MRRILFIFIALLFGFSSLFAADESDGLPAPIQQSLIDLGFRVFKAPVEAPDFELENLAGGKTKLSSYRGKVVFLNFWATWCPPCRAEMPSMQALYEELGNDHFEIVGIDLQESRRTVQDFVNEYELTFPILLDSTGAVGATYGARSIPTTFLIDRDGNAIGFLVGSRSWEGIEVESIFRTIIGD